MTDHELRLVLQVALLGEVGPRLRAVAFHRSKNEVEVSFYFDGWISEEDRESASVVATEVTAALPECVRVREKLVRCDSPAPITSEHPLVFRRRE
jgi:hypothetical protein